MCVCVDEGWCLLLQKLASALDIDAICSNKLLSDQKENIQINRT